VASPVLDSPSAPSRTKFSPQGPWLEVYVAALLCSMAGSGMTLTLPDMDRGLLCLSVGRASLGLPVQRAAASEDGDGRASDRGVALDPAAEMDGAAER
jgi:hypothetical protein